MFSLLSGRDLTLFRGNWRESGNIFISPENGVPKLKKVKYKFMTYELWTHHILDPVVILHCLENDDKPRFIHN